ncbi:MAG TPA: hypothetical protein DCZ95_11465 [Verrucomicrobia bacterium]|nr:MAG: hypothetical protein A2X46_04135 [Lentisphaerae bacterium GWF2_57_35]HBA84702.1 hypothetical protein [Verrucomicrobiota bacterium]
MAASSIKRISLSCVALFWFGYLVLNSGCSAPSWQAQPDSSELYRHNWWNYYQRGLLLLANGDYQSAREDLERCLGLRSGATYEFARDMWKARTYGMHFLDDYFPHRELGVCCYYLEDWSRAQHFLEKSLAQEPSGRAKFYLNLTRKHLLTSVQASPPSVRILDGMPSTTWTSNRSVRIEGLAAGDGFVNCIFLGPERLFLEEASREVSFSKQWKLQRGANEMVIVAADLKNQETKHPLRLMADWQPPAVLIKNTRYNGTQWIFDGICLDDGVLESLEVNGKLIPTATKSHGPIAALPFSIPCEPNQQIILIAKDAAQNCFRTILTPPSTTTSWMPSFLLAMTAPGETTDAGNGLQLDEHAPHHADGDALKPSLRLIGPKMAHVFDEEYYLDCLAGDRGGLAGISINGEENLPAEHKGILEYRFARRLGLDMGTNLFSIAARDSAGNEKRIDLTVIRKQAEFLSEEYRLSIGVPPFSTYTTNQFNDPVQEQSIRRMVENALLASPIRFRLLERDEGWDYILQEQRLSLSDLTDPAAALRIGKMLPAELLLMTTLIRQGHGVTAYARVVDTSEGEVLCTDDVYYEGSENRMPEQIDGLMMKIKQRFPLLEGKIVTLSGDKLTVGIGAGSGVRPGAKFVVLRAHKGEAVEAAEIVRCGEKTAEVVIVKPKADTSLARVIPAEAGKTIKTGDYVYAR